MRLTTNKKSPAPRVIAPGRSRKLRADAPRKELQVRLASLPKTAIPLVDGDAPERIATLCLDPRPELRSLRVAGIPRTAVRLAAGIDRAKLLKAKKKPNQKPAEAAEDAYQRISLLKQRKNNQLLESAEYAEH